MGRRESRRRVLQATGGALLSTTLTGCTNWSRDDTPFEGPTTGSRVPELGGVDDVMQSFVAENDVPAAALAVAKDGEIVLERGYGHSDSAGRVPTAPDATFRIASVTKPFTSAAVKTLIGDGRLAMDDRPFRELDLEPRAGDARTGALDGVTVSHLLEHEGGWDIEELGYDPTNHQFAIADALDLERTPTSRDVVRYMLSEPLQFEPGTDSAYSNFGYMVLGVLLERITGTSFPAFVRSALYDEDVEDTLYEGSTLPGDRPDREVAYDSTRDCENAATLDPQDQVPCADGGITIESIGGAGELVANTRTLLSFADEYLITGDSRGRTAPNYVFYGSLPGTSSMLRQRRDGVDVAALFNRHGATPRGFRVPDSVFSDAIDDVDDWP
jgi:hypothetical protein